MNYLAIDPSINNLGWATYESNSKDWHSGTISPKGKNLQERLEFIWYALQPMGNPGQLIIEFPQFFSGSLRGSVAAVEGTTLGLAAIAGYLQAAYAHMLRPKDVFHYTPSEWKGQTPKAGMMYRFEHKFGFQAKSDHQAEAALLLDYHLQELKLNKSAK